jgi:deoxyribose-phosphate aldolase
MLEFSLLSLDEKVRAAVLAQDAGIAVVTNSGGWGKGGPATVDDIMLLRSVVAKVTKVKASGEIRDLDTALKLIDSGADFLGTRSGVAIIDELRRRTSTGLQG